MDQVWRSQIPHGWAKLQDLGRDAPFRIFNTILRPAHSLTQVIGSRGKAVISTLKIGKCPHLVVFPNEAKIDIPGSERPKVEEETAPKLPPWLRRGSLGNTHDNARGIFHVPCDTAVWSAECVEIGEHTVSPQRSVPGLVSRQSGITCRPSLVIDAVSGATGAAE